MVTSPWDTTFLAEKAGPPWCVTSSYEMLALRQTDHNVSSQFSNNVFLAGLAAERQPSAAAGSGSGADAVGSRLQGQTVSKPRFWSMRALQVIDFVRQHFRKIDF